MLVSVPISSGKENGPGKGVSLSVPGSCWGADACAPECARVQLVPTAADCVRITRLTRVLVSRQFYTQCGPFAFFEWSYMWPTHAMFAHARLLPGSLESEGVAGNVKSTRFFGGGD